MAESPTTHAAPSSAANEAPEDGAPSTGGTAAENAALEPLQHATYVIQGAMLCLCVGFAAIGDWMEALTSALGVLGEFIRSRSG